MKRPPRILAGTALGLLMASAPIGAYPLTGSPMAPSATLPLIDVQAECPPGQECEPRQRPGRERPERSREEAAPERQERRPERQQQAEPAERAPRDRPERQQPEQRAQPERQREEQPRRQRTEEPERQQRQERAEPQREQAPASEPRQAAPERPQREAPAQASPREDTRPERQRDEQRQATPEERRPEQPAAEQTPPREARPERGETERPRGERPNGEQANRPRGEEPQRPAQTGPAQTPPNGEAPATQQGQAPAQGEAPLLDSQKEAAPRDGDRPRRGGERDRAGSDRPAGERPGGDRDAQRPPVQAGPPPANDRAAQESAQPREVRPVTQEEGRRRDRRPDDDSRRRERPAGADVVRELGDRLIIELGGRTIVESSERPRMTRGARDVYYEDLQQGRTREVILRDNGVRIVTIRNRYGDVIQRSRIDGNGREYVLSYVDERNYERVRDWRDPGDDLPPLRLAIPRNQYIFDAGVDSDSDDYYEFLEQPPVERVERLYSVDEVKRSARVRDIARRIDLDTLTFEFGSATIPESEIAKLEGVATAMERLLEKNPAETFLIEGHTDAVGSDIANLALSDRRAEAVAQALTDVFAIPPENLSTQGYGERYLKVATEVAERENRRVAIRRITALVAPMAQAN